MKFWDKVTHFYIKNVKRWMFCPNCYGEGKPESRMHVDRKNDNWVCDTCGYVLPCKLYDDDMTFWFCDGCGTYLNYQEGFAEINKRWQCTKCGFDNDVTENNIINVCCRCGKTMPKDYKPLLCSECQQDVAIKVVKFLELTSELCAQIVESLNAIEACRDVDYGNSPNECAYALQQIYYDSNGETKDKIDKTVRKFTGKTLSEAMDVKFTCANCGNTNVSSLFDEGDTIYCGKCCHRTRKSDGQDDLMVCPVCRHLRDRKAMYCQWCNTTDRQGEYSAEAEEAVNEFEEKLTPKNIRYYKLKGRRSL